MEDVSEPNVAVAVELQAGGARGSQPQREYGQGYSKWSAPMIAANVVFPTRSALQFGFAARYQYLVFDSGFENAPHVKYHYGSLGPFLGLVVRLGHMVDTGPRVGLAYFRTSQIERNQETYAGGDYSGVVLSVDWNIYVHLGRTWGLVSNVGLAGYGQGGAGEMSPIGIEYLGAIGMRLDIER